jgi:hypothetical protein
MSEMPNGPVQPEGDVERVEDLDEADVAERLDRDPDAQRNREQAPPPDEY